MKISNIIALVLFLLIGNTTFAQDWANLGKYAKANSALEMPKKGETRVVFMGNSITEKWSKYDSAFWAENPYVNRGISGQVSSQMLLRFRPDVIELQPTVVIISAGTNDIAQNQGPTTLEQIAGNIFSMAELAKAHNIKVVLAAVLPADSYRWRPEIKPADSIVKLNKLIKKYAKQNNIVYLDYYSPMVNKNKGLKKEYGRDSVHPSTVGYKVMEPMVKSAINKALHRN